MHKRVLFVYPGDTADPSGSGGQKRVYNLLATLTDGNEVFVLESSTETRDDHAVPGARRFTFWHPLPDLLIDCNPLYAFTLGRLLLSEDIDVVHVVFPSGVLAAKVVSLLLGRDAPVVFGAQNATGDMIDVFTDAPNLPAYKRLGGRVYIPALERIAVSVADHVTTVSDDVAARLQDLYGAPGAKFTVIPTGTEVADAAGTDEGPSVEEVRARHDVPGDDVVLIFHGIYGYKPNRGAISLVRDSIAPEIAATHDDVTFVIAGKDVPEFDDGPVRSLGFVEDLSALLAAVDIAVVPLVEGGGTKLKTFDYMGAGLPIVSTPEGVEGTELTPGEDVLIAEDVDSAFLDHVETLVESADERERLGRNARAVARREHDWAKTGRRLDELYEQLLARTHR